MQLTGNEFMSLLQKKLLLTVSIGLLCLGWALSPQVTRGESAFRQAFYRASQPCEYNDLLSRWDVLIKAARELDRTADGRIIVESVSFKALRGHLRERWAAFMVLTSRQVDLSPEGRRFLENFATLNGLAEAHKADVNNLLREIGAHESYRRAMQIKCEGSTVRPQ